MSHLSLVALFIGTVIVAWLAFEGGLKFGIWRSRRPDPEPVLPVRTLVAGILSLLAFVLGFTFGLASSHFDSRHQSVFDETIAISTAYHRTDLLSDPERTSLRQLLRDYVDLRLKMNRSGKTDEAIRQLRQLQERMWAQAIAAEKRNNGTPSAAPLLQSLTDIIDIHGERVLAGVSSRIPDKVWIALYGIMVVSLAAAGYHAGLAGSRRSLSALAYALVFAAVIAMIAAGDVPGPDQTDTNYQTLTNLRARLTPP